MTVFEALRLVVWNDAEHRPRTGWRLLAHLLLALVLAAAGALALSPVVALVAGAGLLAATPPVATFAANVAFVAAVVVAATLLAARYLDRRELVDLGLGADAAWGRDLAFGLALGAGLQSAVLLTFLAAGWTTITGAGGPPARLLASLGFGLLAMVAVGGYEELLFRGYYLTNVAEGVRALPGVDARRGALLAAALTSLAFGGVHWLNPNATALSTTLVVVYGAYLAAGYLLTGELAIPVGFHVAWNYVQGFVYGLPVSGTDPGPSLLGTETSGPALLTGGAFGPEAGLVGLAWLLVSLPTLGWWVRRTRGDLGVRAEVAEPALRWRPARVDD